MKKRVNVFVLHLISQVFHTSCLLSNCNKIILSHHICVSISNEEPANAVDLALTVVVRTTVAIVLTGA